MEQTLAKVPGHYLYPCMVFAHRREFEVTTVLGSCVSVCLWDKTLETGGMNHYMLALWNGDGLPTPKYGNIAIERLVRAMVDQGCATERLVAKVFGGGNVIGPGLGVFTVGERNVALAREQLAEARIPIVASDVGGDCGRKVIFNTRTGAVLMSRIKRIDGRPLDLPDGRPR
jgi:chemotaxis protein CheD